MSSLAKAAVSNDYFVQLVLRSSFGFFNAGRKLLSLIDKNSETGS